MTIDAGPGSEWPPHRVWPPVRDPADFGAGLRPIREPADAYLAALDLPPAQERRMLALKWRVDHGRLLGDTGPDMDPWLLPREADYA